jgi:hypothetical protein
MSLDLRGRHERTISSGLRIELRVGLCPVSDYVICLMGADRNIDMDFTGALAKLRATESSVKREDSHAR